MRTTMSRTEYDREIERELRIILGARALNPNHQAKLPPQYPKNATEALLELWHRGAAARRLPEDRSYSQDELDNIVETAELCGWLTDEALVAQAHGLSLLEYRRVLDDPDSPENRLGV